MAPLLCLALCLGLVWAAEAQEPGQVITFLYWAVMPIPTDEYRRAVWYRFLPEGLETAAPDSTTVT